MMQYFDRAVPGASNGRSFGDDVVTFGGYGVVFVTLKP